MTEIEFFLKLFPQTYETTNKDVFVNFDDDRNNQMINHVQQFAKSRQVIVLTCHKRTLEAYSAKGANAITFG